MVGPESPPLVILTGPTATQKTAVGMWLARKLNAEIVSADSVQVYCYMDIGTAKPALEMRRAVPHHMVDVVAPDEGFSAARFQELADQRIREIHGRGKTVLVVGGSGLYIRALAKGLFRGPSGDEGLRERLRQAAEKRGLSWLRGRLERVDPEAAKRIHPNDLFRTIRALEVFCLTGVPISTHQRRHAFSKDRYRAFYIGLTVDRSELYRSIDERVDQMVAQGLLEEVEGLIRRGYGLDLPAMNAIGYRHMGRYIKGECAWQEAVAEQKRDTRHYARRQMTWFGRMPEIHWHHPGEAKEILENIRRFLE